MKIYQVGSYALTVVDARITSFELVETGGGIVPKIGELFYCYFMKVGIRPVDITPVLIKEDTIYSIDKMDVKGWKSLFANPCRR